MNNILSRTLIILLTASILSSLAVAQRDIRSIVVEDTLIANPRTPKAMLRAVRDLINVGEYELAKDFLQKTLEAQLSDQQLLELHREMGSTFFLRIQRTRQLSPVGNQLTRRVTQAATDAARDPQVVARLIEAARSNDEDERRSARGELTQIGASVVPQLIDAINNEKRRDQNQWLFAALAAIGKPAVPPLIATVGSNDPRVVYQGVAALQFIPSEAALPFLFQPYFNSSTTLRREAGKALEAYGTGLPSRQTAAAVLRNRIHRLLTDPNAMAQALDGQATAWWWSAEKQQLLSRKMSRHDKALLHAAWLARDLYRIEPADPRHREYYLLTQLGWNKVKHGLNTDLPESFFVQLGIGKQVDATELNQILDRAIELDIVPSTLATIEALGHYAAIPCYLEDCDDRIRTLSRALRHPELRVRFAAAKAILRLDPRDPFGGASDLMDVVAQSVGSRGHRTALIVHNRLDQADQMLGSLVGLGFEAKVATGGKQALRIARTDPDIELILLSESVGRPRWTELLQQLRHDYHTKNLPICLISRAQELRRVEDVATGYRQVDSYPLPHDQQTMQNLLQQVLPLTSRFATTPSDRLVMANQALRMVHPIASNRTLYSFYEFMPYESQFIDTLGVPDLTTSAARLLSGLGTPAAQSALLDMAGQSFQPVSVRKLAAQEFDRSIQQSGIMLRHRQVLAQYQRYNEIYDSDEESAEVLSGVLDSIEKYSRQN